MSQKDINALIAKIRRAGYHTVRGGQHYLLVDQHGSYVRMANGQPVTIPGTAGDVRSVRNVEAQLRRVGVIPDTRTRRTRRHVVNIESAPNPVHAQGVPRNAWRDRYSLEEIDRDLYDRLFAFVGSEVIDHSTLARRQVIAHTAVRYAKANHIAAWAKSLAKGQATAHTSALRSVGNVLQRAVRSLHSAERAAVMGALDQLTQPVAPDHPEPEPDPEQLAPVQAPEPVMTVSAVSVSVSPTDPEWVITQVEQALAVTDLPRFRQFEILAIVARELF